MLIPKPGDVAGSEITPESVFRDRRRLLAAAVAVSEALVGAGCWPEHRGRGANSGRIS